MTVTIVDQEKVMDAIKSVRSDSCENDWYVYINDTLTINLTYKHNL